MRLLTPAELDALRDEMQRDGEWAREELARRRAARIATVQAALDGDPEILMMIVNVLNACAAKPAWWAREAQAAEVDQIVADIIERARSG